MATYASMVSPTNFLLLCVYIYIYIYCAYFFLCFFVFVYNHSPNQQFVKNFVNKFVSLALLYKLCKGEASTLQHFYKMLLWPALIGFHLGAPLTSFFSFTNKHSSHQQFVNFFVNKFVSLALLYKLCKGKSRNFCLGKAEVKLSYWFFIQEKCKPQHIIYIHTCLHAVMH